MDRLDQGLGVNAGTRIGHTAVRYYAMGEDCQKCTATDDEIKTMQALARDGMQAGAVGFSGSCGRRGITIRKACRSPRCGPMSARSSR